jgi:c-di-GMP-binding flagellar brake protein YcgR
MIERRKHPRIEVCHPAMYDTLIYASPRVATTVDLSEGGTRIETPYSLISGTGLQMSIAIPPKVIECKGRVVHVDWHDGERLKAGVEFEDLPEEDKLHLKQHISKLLEQQKQEGRRQFS